MHEAEMDDRLTLSGDFVERWDADFEPWLRSGVHGFYVASLEDSDAVRGFVHIRLYDEAPIFDTPRQVMVEALWVDPDARRSGLATALVDAARSWASDHGARRLRYGVLAADAVAVAFWRRKGGDDLLAYGTVDIGAAEPDKRRSG